MKHNTILLIIGYNHKILTDSWCRPSPSKAPPAWPSPPPHTLKTCIYEVWSTSWHKRKTFGSMMQVFYTRRQPCCCHLGSGTSKCHVGCDPWDTTDIGGLSAKVTMCLHSYSVMDKKTSGPLWCNYWPEMGFIGEGGGDHVSLGGKLRAVGGRA